MQSPDGRTVATSEHNSQHKLLFGATFSDVAGQNERGPRLHVLIIDALDEWGSGGERKVLPKCVLQMAMAECMLQMASRVSWMKLFVTGGPVPEIRAVLATLGSKALAVDNLKAEAQTDDDICTPIHRSQVHRS